MSNETGSGGYPISAADSEPAVTAKDIAADIIAMRMTTSLLLAVVGKQHQRGAMDTLRLYRSTLDKSIIGSDEDLISQMREALDRIFSDAMSIASVA